MKKSVHIDKTSKYISIASELRGRMPLIDPNQQIRYLDVDITEIEFGEEIIKKLSESYEISDSEFMEYDLA